MPKYFKTTQMELGLHLLCERNPRVILNSLYQAERPIFLRKSLLKDIHIIQLKPPLSGLPDVLPKWQHVLQMPVGMHSRHLMPECDALFLPEAPLQACDLEWIEPKVNREIVIYKPPTWFGHEMTIDKLWPRAELSQMVYTFVKPLAKLGLNQDLIDHLPRMLKPVAFTLADLPDYFGCTDVQLARAMNYLGSKNFKWFARYRLFIEPEDQGLRETWGLIKEHALKLNDGVYSFQSNWIVGAPPNFKRALVTLQMQGNIQRLPNIYVLDLAMRGVNWSRLLATNQAYRGQWYRMQQLVDSLPDITDQ